MQSFHELGVSSSVAQALAERDIHAPFRIQALVLPDVLYGRDAYVLKAMDKIRTKRVA